MKKLLMTSLLLAASVAAYVEYAQCERFVQQRLLSKGVTPRTITVRYILGSKSISKNILCLGAKPGINVNRVFTPLRTVLVNLAKQGASAAKIKSYKALYVAGVAGCKSIPSATPTPSQQNGGTTPTPRPTATATPRSQPTSTPTNTPTPATGHFDSQGNVTASGKAVFGIPSNMNANISTGHIVFSANCVGCHAEKTSRSYGQVSNALTTVPDMSYIQLSSQQIADITAYLERFNP